MRIYTKSGDAGDTGLYGGDRIAKQSPRIHAIGDVDELNAAIGLARVYSGGSELDPILYQIQNWLFDTGAELACAPGSKFSVAAVQQRHSELLEQSMDEQSEALPELKNFILPGGSALASHLHVARAVCRRAERSVLALHELEQVREEVRIFLNRLSDWLFVASRTANHVENVNDIAWKLSENI